MFHLIFMTCLFVCLLENNFFLKSSFKKISFLKVNYFFMLANTMKNELENTF
jgi:hypothetical protein